MSTSSAYLTRKVLRQYGDMTRARVGALLRREAKRDELYRVAADYPQRGGRGLRASLCIAAARAFGASLDQAIDTATSLELLHSAFLVHDDVEDDSEERRGKPTLHVLHGVPAAINVGDALAVLGLKPLVRNQLQLGTDIALRILDEAQHMARESVEGQALELRWRDDNALDLTEDDYLRMILKKTCWYTTIYPCRVGALIGGRRALASEDFVRFGFFLGAAFQIQDDALNLVGDHDKYGKEISGDILEGKRTLMLIHVLRRSAPDERAKLGRMLSLPRRRRTRDDVDWVCDLMRRHRSVEHAREFAHGLAGAAQHEFALAFEKVPPSRDRDFIEGLPQWMLERK